MEGVTTWQVDWSDWYGELEPGLYEILWLISDFRTEDDKDSVLETARFVIPSGDSSVMVPTLSEVTGIYDNYLFFTIDGNKYRYERQALMPGGIRQGKKLANVFEADVQPSERTPFGVYAVEGCKDNSMLLVHSVRDDFMWLYRYSPATGTSPSDLQKVKEQGYVVMEDRVPTSGQEIWQDFYEKVQKGTDATVMLASYFTMDQAGYSELYHEAHKEDFPMLVLQELTYDGTRFSLYDGNTVRHYRYLMRYTDTLTGKIEYVLTHDNTVTWRQLWDGLTSSQEGAYIDHYNLYCELPNE